MEPVVSVSPMQIRSFSERLPLPLALIFAALLCGCGEGTGTARDAAEEMSRRFAEQRFAEAYAQAASAFRFTRSANYFEARVRDLGLCEATEAKWDEPERHGRLAKVRGIFTLKGGGKLALNCTFTMEEGAWRLIETRSDPAPGTGKIEDVFAVAARTRDSASARAMEIMEPNAPGIPPEQHLRQLAEATLMLFNEAIQNGGDFSPMYAAASDRWKYRGRDPRELTYGGSDPSRIAKLDPYNTENRLTTTALRNAFAAAVEARVDLSPIRGTRLLLSEAARVNSDGVLTVKGTFDASVYQASSPGVPRKLDFSLEYVNEAGQWKLFGLTVNVVARDTPPASNP
jgi:hypothetical protein